MRTILAVALAVSTWSCMSGIAQKKTEYPNERKTLEAIEAGGIVEGCTVLRSASGINLLCTGRGMLMFASQNMQLVVTCTEKLADNCGDFADKVIAQGGKGLPEPAPEPQSHAGKAGDLSITVDPARLGASAAALEAAWGKPDKDEKVAGTTIVVLSWYAKGISAQLDSGGKVQSVQFHSGRCCSTGGPMGKIDDTKFAPFVGSTADGASIDATRSSLREKWGYANLASKQQGAWATKDATYTVFFTDEGRVLMYSLSAPAAKL